MFLIGSFKVNGMPLPCHLQAVFLFQLQGRYLQMQVGTYLKMPEYVTMWSLIEVWCLLCQGIIWPQVVTGAIGNVLNAIVNAIFLYVLDLGVV